MMATTMLQQKQNNAHHFLTSSKLQPDYKSREATADKSATATVNTMPERRVLAELPRSRGVFST